MLYGEEAQHSADFDRVLVNRAAEKLRIEMKEAREKSVSNRKDMLSISAIELPDVFKTDPTATTTASEEEEEDEEEEEKDIFDIVGEGTNGLGQRKRDMERRLSVASVSDSVGSGGGESVNNNFDDWYVKRAI